jgi:hypothetical protein
MKIKWTRFDSVNTVALPNVIIPNFTPCIGPGAAIQAGQMKVRGDDSIEIDAAGLREEPRDYFWFTDTRGITYLSVPAGLFVRVEEAP